MTDQITTTAPAEQQRNTKFKNGKRVRIIQDVIIYSILVLYALIIILPFIIVILTSLKTWQDASSPTFTLNPSMGYSFEGYLEVLTYNPTHVEGVMPTLFRSFFNTLMYIIPPTVIGLFTSSLAAYAFAKLRFRMKNILYTVLLATMMIPGTIMIVPQFSMYDTIGWIDTPLPLMVPGMFGAAACVFFMRQFYSGIPDSLVEAAKIDGLGFVGIFFQIMVPLSVPALLAQGLLGFIGGYNDYLGPLLYLQTSELKTLQIALNDLSSQYGMKQNVVMAGAIVALIPLLIVYFICQQYFIEGIVTSGLKD